MSASLKEGIQSILAANMINMMSKLVKQRVLKLVLLRKRKRKSQAMQQRRRDLVVNLLNREKSDR
jgi:hypothetical protein